MKHLFKLSLLLLALLLPATALAHDFYINGIYYYIKNANEVSVSFKGDNFDSYSNEYSGSLTIPSTVTYNGRTYFVTEIGYAAFYYCTGLTSVTIPNSVTTIGESAFLGCSNLTSIEIPNSITTIGNQAFSRTAWYNNQPDGLVYAGLVAYTYKGTMPSGTSIIIRDGTYSITGTAFYNCTGLTSVTIPSSVTSIGEAAFYGCSGITSIYIPNSVTSIGSSAFQNCNGLTSVTIPNSVTSIGEQAFYGCSGLTSIVISNSVTTIEGWTFSGCSGLTSITIPNSVTSIGEQAFRECSSLTSVTIGNSVTSIGDDAFSGCSSLANITIPNSVTSIGVRAFYGCNGLTSVTIGNSVTSIGQGAFVHCSGLTSITIPNSVTTIGQGAFVHCSGLTSITIGNSVTSIGDYAFNGCSNLTEIYSLALVPPTIDSYTFYGCYGATLNVPKEEVNTYKMANYWKYFSNIVGVILPGYTFEVDGIYYRVMSDDAANVIANVDVESYYTGDVVIPDSVTYEGYSFAVMGIESNAFDGCFELTSVVIPNSVETIGEQAFQGCTGLTSVTIGRGVTTIGAKAFNYCNALTTVKCLGMVPPVMASTDCFTATAYNRATLLVPRNYEATYTAADYWYKFAHIDGWGSAGRGDIDGDGRVSIADVTTLIDAILSGNNEGIYFESADLNINDRLDIGDVTTLIDMLLNDN